MIHLNANLNYAHDPALDVALTINNIPLISIYSKLGDLFTSIIRLQFQFALALVRRLPG